MCGVYVHMRKISSIVQYIAIRICFWTITIMTCQIWMMLGERFSSNRICILFGLCCLALLKARAKSRGATGPNRFTPFIYLHICMYLFMFNLVCGHYLRTYLHQFVYVQFSVVSSLVEWCL